MQNEILNSRLKFILLLKNILINQATQRRKLVLYIVKKVQYYGQKSVSVKAPSSSNADVPLPSRFTINTKVTQSIPCSGRYEEKLIIAQKMDPIKNPLCT